MGRRARPLAAGQRGVALKPIRCDCGYRYLVVVIGWWLGVVASSEISSIQVRLASWQSSPRLVCLGDERRTGLAHTGLVCVGAIKQTQGGSLADTACWRPTCHFSFPSTRVVTRSNCEASISCHFLPFTPTLTQCHDAIGSLHRCQGHEAGRVQPKRCWLKIQWSHRQLQTGRESENTSWTVLGADR